MRELTHPAELISPTFTLLARKVFRWGTDRGITGANGATVAAQMVKLREELAELEAAVAPGDRLEQIDGLGDSLVVLIQVARLLGISFDAALAQAWHDIKDRKGQMKFGIFVKEDDIWKMQEKGISLDTIQSLEGLKEVLEYLKRNSGN